MQRRRSVGLLWLAMGLPLWKFMLFAGFLAAQLFLLSSLLFLLLLLLQACSCGFYCLYVYLNVSVCVSVSTFFQ